MLIIPEQAPPIMADDMDIDIDFGDETEFAALAKADRIATQVEADRIAVRLTPRRLAQFAGTNSRSRTSSSPNNKRIKSSPRHIWMTSTRTFSSAIRFT